MKKSNYVLLAAMALLFTGCAYNNTIQTDQSFNEDGTPLRIVETRTRIQALFASDAKVSEVIITNTDGEQQTAIGSAGASSEARISDLVQAITAGVVSAVLPVPE